MVLSILPGRPVAPGFHRAVQHFGALFELMSEHGSGEGVSMRKTHSDGRSVERRAFVTLAGNSAVVFEAIIGDSAKRDGVRLRFAVEGSQPDALVPRMRMAHFCACCGLYGLGPFFEMARGGFSFVDRLKPLFDARVTSAVFASTFLGILNDERFGGTLSAIYQFHCRQTKI